MVLIPIKGIQVDFPYEPYSIQIDYMTKVIESLQTGSNALLESPTGTGKTLCLLCASLAWLEHHKRLNPTVYSQPSQNFPSGDDRKKGNRNAEPSRNSDVPRIIYASRTHSQLAQVTRELKKTAYGRTKVTILGSRDQLCINPDVTRLPSNAAKNHACRAKIKAHSCAYHSAVDEKMALLSLEPVRDIEELVGFGKRNKVCPFFLSKNSEKTADLIFMPYNYIFDPAIRRTVKLDLQHAVLILDEGHNVGKVAEEAYSYEVTSTDLAVSIREVGRVLTFMVKRDTERGLKPTDQPQSGSQTTDVFSADNIALAEVSVTQVAELKRAFLDFERAFDAITLSQNPDQGMVKPLSFLTELFVSAGIKQQKYGQLWMTLEKLTLAGEDSDGFVQNTHVASVQKFMELLGIAFGEEARKQNPFFRVYLRYEDVHKKNREGWNTDGVTTKLARVLSVWCMSPGCTMKTIMANGIHSMIITSGTLSPMEPLLKEMMIPFKIQLSNPHIIKSNQIWMGVVGKGPDNLEWTSTYKNKDSIEYRRSLGRGILNLLDVIPDGVLVFFSSYRTMQDSMETWKAEGIFEGMNKKKTCFVEPTNRNDFTTALTEYFRLVKETENGAVFFGVCRGKISEGVDFPDCCARAVILTGLPYPARMEPRIRVKMEYLDQSYQSVETKTLTSNEWYNREAWSAVNQALGRVIRHAKDFGACILCDVRFEYEGSKRQLSGWLKNSSRNYNFPTAKRSLNEFFQSHGRAPRITSSLADTPSSQLSKSQTRPKRNLSPDPLCSSQCSSQSRSCLPKLVFDDAALSIYSNQPKSALSALTSTKAKPLTSVFAAMNAKALNPVTPLRVHFAEPPKEPLIAIESTFASSSQSRSKIHVKPPRPFQLDMDDVIQSAESSVAGVPVGFVKVVSSPAPRVEKTVTGKPAIAEAISKMKRDLNDGDFKKLTGILADLRKPGTRNCSALTVALEGLGDKRVSYRIALLLGNFIPGQFRKEYDVFLNDCGIVVQIE